MSVTRPTTVLQPFPSSSNSAPLLHLDSINLLPFQITHDGPARISTFFPTRPRTRLNTPATKNTLVSESILVDSPRLLQSSFRGRHVLSTPLKVPQEYTGLIFTTSVPTLRTTSNSRDSDDRRVKRVKVEQKVSVEAQVASNCVGEVGGRPARRTSPRKKVAVVKYSMDSDEEEEEEKEVIEVKMEVEVKVEVELKAMIVDAVMLEEEDATDVDIPTACTSGAASPATVSDISQATFTPLAPLVPTSSLTTLASAPESQTFSPNPEQDETQEQDQVEESDSIRDVQELIPYATFDTIQIWNADYELDVGQDVFCRTLSEWIGVGSKIHAY